MAKTPGARSAPQTSSPASSEVMKISTGEKLGQALIDACQDSPHRDVEIAPMRMAAPVGDVTL